MNYSSKLWHQASKPDQPPRYLIFAIVAVVGIVIPGWVGCLLCFGQPVDVVQTNQRGLQNDESGEVGPIGIHPAAVGEDADFSHGENAVFHGHGEKVCASGCAVSRHPTDRLGKREYLRLIDQLAAEPASIEQEEADSSLALDTLVFYGRQTSQKMKRYGTGDLSAEAVASLERELKYTHARISIRVVDEAGETRSWLAPTKVPFDRRHVFSMETHQLQPLVTSGTVKRVGRDHLWTRL